MYFALTGMTQWDGQCTTNRKVAGSIPRNGTCLCCGPGLQLGECERQPKDVSLAH